MLVSAADKVATLAAIVSDLEEVTRQFIAPSWDGTFADLHRFCDANAYLVPVWTKMPGVAVAACNEVTEFLDKAFASLGFVK